MNLSFTNDNAGMRDELFNAKRKTPGLRTRRSIIGASIISFIVLTITIGFSSYDDSTTSSNTAQSTSNNNILSDKSQGTLSDTASQTQESTTTTKWQAQQVPITIATRPVVRSQSSGS